MRKARYHLTTSRIEHVLPLWAQVSDWLTDRFWPDTCLIPGLRGWPAKGRQTTMIFSQILNFGASAVGDGEVTLRANDLPSVDLTLALRTDDYCYSLLGMASNKSVRSLNPHSAKRHHQGCQGLESRQVGKVKWEPSAHSSFSAWPCHKQDADAVAVVPLTSVSACVHVYVARTQILRHLVQKSVQDCFASLSLKKREREIGQGKRTRTTCRSAFHQWNLFEEEMNALLRP